MHVTTIFCKKLLKQGLDFMNLLFFCSLIEKASTQRKAMRSAHQLENDGRRF